MNLPTPRLHLLTLPFLTLLTALAGCATKPMLPDEARPIPAEQIIQADLDEGLPITVLRDRGFIGSACRILFSVDGAHTARIATQERFDFHLPEGEYVFQAESTGICGGGTDSLTARIQGDRRIYYRVAVGQSGDISLNPYMPPQ